MNWLLVFIGGGVGSVARFGIGKLVQFLFQASFPLGTFISNLLACLIIGLVLMLAQKGARTEWIESLVIAGFCGGLSTFSTFSNENIQMIQSGDHWMALLNIVFSVASGMVIIWSLTTFKA